ncbi:MAG: DinB family protein [Lewinellaceae bacterium]|nr:DinB family protein [Lewinellaceae bacterium]
MITQNDFLAELRQRLETLTQTIAQITHDQDLSVLRKHPASGGWSVLDCLEHLNLYSDFYLPAFQKAIHRGKTRSSGATYRAGWLGAYFVKSMATTPQGMPVGPMKTFKDKNPSLVGTPSDALARFQEQHQELLQLLDAATATDLQRTRVPISIAPWLRIQLGDGLHFFISHEERHLAQIQRTLAEVFAGQFAGTP